MPIISVKAAEGGGPALENGEKVIHEVIVFPVVYFACVKMADECIFFLFLRSWRWEYEIDF